MTAVVEVGGVEMDLVVDTASFATQCVTQEGVKGRRTSARHHTSFVGGETVGDVVEASVRIGGLWIPRMAVVVGLQGMPDGGSDGVLGLLTGCGGGVGCVMDVGDIPSLSIHRSREESSDWVGGGVSMSLGAWPRRCQGSVRFVHGVPGSGRGCDAHPSIANRPWMRLHRIVVAMEQSAGGDCDTLDLEDVWVMFDTALTTAVSFHHADFDVQCDAQRPITGILLQQHPDGPEAFVPVHPDSSFPSCVPTCPALEQMFRGRGWLSPPPFIILGLQFLTQVVAVGFSRCGPEVESTMIEMENIL